MIHDLRAEGNDEDDPPTGSAGVPKGISETIRQWAENNGWYEIGLSTNQLRLQQAFGEIIEIIAHDLKYQHHFLHRHQLYNCWDQLTGLCRQIDMVCRAGCRNEEELLELEFLRGRAVAAATELAEVIRIVQEGQVPRRPTPAAFGREDEWINVTEAAEILEVSKSTISKWTKEGKIKHNSMRGHRRRLSRLSILLVKQEREDSFLRGDLKDLKEDAKRIMNS